MAQGDCFSKGVHDYYAGYTGNADSKIGVLLAANVGIGGLILRDFPGDCVPAFLAGAAVAAQVVAAAFLFFAIYPRLDKSGERGLLFWEHVRKFPSSSKYAEAVTELDAAAAERVYAENNYAVAGILHRKFQAIQWALVATAVGLALAGASLGTA